MENISKSITEIVLLQNIGIIRGGGINYPTWYLSVSVTAELVLFWMYKSLKPKKYAIIALFTIGSVYGYLVYCGGIEIWDRRFIFYMPWWRGVAGLMMGTLIYQYQYKISGWLVNVPLVHLMEVLDSAMLFGCIVIKDYGFLDFVGVFCIVVLVVIMTTPYSLYGRIPKWKLSKYEYAIFLNHALIIGIVHKIFNAFELQKTGNIAELFVVLAGTILYSAGTSHMIEGMAGVICRFRRKGSI